MTNSIPDIAKAKNQWLYQHVDVKYPTKECIAGRKLYKQRISERNYHTLEVLDWQPTVNNIQLELHKVDFHRLTVMFALLQSKQWHVKSDQDLIVEFLTQIIYSEPCDLYLGFKGGEAVAAGIVTQENGKTLLSDIVVSTDSALECENTFITELMSTSGANKLCKSDVYLER